MTEGELTGKPPVISATIESISTLLETRTPSLGLRCLLLLLIAVPATAFFCLLRVATEAGVPHLGFVFWQCLGGSVLFALIFAVRRKKVPLG